MKKSIMKCFLYGMFITTILTMVGCSMTESGSVVDPSTPTKDPSTGGDGTGGDGTGGDGTGGGGTGGDSTGTGGGGTTVTGGGDGKGVVVTAKRDTVIVFKSSGLVDSITADQTIQLQDFRDEIAKEGILLSGFYITNFGLSITDKSSEAAVAAHAATPVVILLYAEETGKTPQLLSIESAALNNPRGPLTLGRLISGVKLNDGLFASETGGFPNFMNMVRDVNKKSASFRAVVKFKSPISLGLSEFKVNMEIEGQGKKKL